MRKALMFAVVLAAALGLSRAFVWAQHNTVTVANPTVVFTGAQTWNVSSSASVRNTTANAQTGPLTLYVLQVNAEGRVQEVLRRDLGIVTLPAQQLASAPAVPFTVQLHARGSYVLLADFNSGIAHTHCGTNAFVIN